MPIFLFVLSFLLISPFQILHRKESDQQATYGEPPNLRSMAFTIQPNHDQVASKTFPDNQQPHNNEEVAVRVISLPGKDILDRSTVWINAGLFIVGIGGVVAAFCTFRSVKNSSERQLRAYVSVGIGAAVYQERAKGFQFGALPILENTGQTPAYNVRWVIKAAVLPKELPPTYILSEVGEDSGNAILAVNQRVNMHARAEGFVPDDEVEDIKLNRRDKALFVWGIVRYRDAFDRNRYTRFCHRVLWLEGSADIYGYFVPNRNDAD